MTQTHTTAAAENVLGRPALRQYVAATLFVDFGDRDRAPRARYECVRCGYASGIVTGSAAVAAFTAMANETHRSVCTALQGTNQ